MKSDNPTINAFIAHTQDIALGLRNLSGDWLGETPEPRGRPTKASQAKELGITHTPILAMITEPADRLCAIIRSMDDVPLLRECYRFEIEHDRRKSVFRELETRLRRLGSPLGGPASEPFAGYREASIETIERKLVKRGCPRFAAHVYAFEFYRQRRRHVLALAESLCGKAGRVVVKETSTSFQRELPEPFPGYDDLKATPQGRSRVRELLGEQCVSALQDALKYEENGRNRRVMLQAISRALAIAA